MMLILMRPKIRTLCEKGIRLSTLDRRLSIYVRATMKKNVTMMRIRSLRRLLCSLISTGEFPKFVTLHYGFHKLGHKAKG